ncbi:hypothetical protein BDQ12DRAFT_170939 [Crucibulum laeve]|uniref:HBS1-like protein N-terminal domain-containing protein n=1 Tax=Crucibulum laeve TaxID=68775 RepID=A0A5C3MCS4_9AGAR|nr:hypothetical protein BDQ12DRAFT_170939 [Crucibulum laeve]
MSRHRIIRNMNIDDELDDDALSDGAQEELTPEEQEQMEDAFDYVRQVIGGEDASGISDTAIKDILWGNYFDAQHTVQWALEEQERRQMARERKDWPGKQLPLVPQDDEDQYGYQEHHGYIDEEEGYGDGEHEVRSRLPLIHLAQQQGGVMYSEPGTPAPVQYRLSTITERTERTELSPYWARQQLAPPDTPRGMSSSASTSYGQVIENNMSEDGEAEGPQDPNFIPVSPSGSAIQRLSTYDPPPTNSPSESRSPQSTPRAPSIQIPPSEAIPDIPDLSSKSSKPVPIPPPVKEPPKKSKLAMLASSRASTASSMSTISESSRSSGTSLTGSVKTFPALRPSAQSIRPPSSVSSSAISKSLPPPPRSITSTTPSSTSSHVRRAIQAAMQLEALDRNATPKPATEKPLPSEASDRSKTPTPITTRPAAPTPSKTAEMPSSSPSRSPAQTSAPPPRPLSKLALLAQAKQIKADPSRAPKLPKTTTEYLTPIANGSSVTTAITTSYQSLYSLTDPSRPAIIPKLNVVPLNNNGPSSPDVKQSKLAMKIKKAQEKQRVEPPPPEEVITPPVSPMFNPTRSPVRASPSAFASLLISDALSPPEDEGRSGEKSGEKRHKHRPTTSDVITKDSEHRHRSRSRTHKHPKAPIPDFASTSSFAFDGPSPDDVVLKARQGTALGKQKPSSRTGAGVGNVSSKG